MVIRDPMQWKALPKDIKDRYEERARVIAMESAKKISEAASSDSAAHANDTRSMSPHSAAHLQASGISTALLTFQLFLICDLLVAAGFLRVAFCSCMQPQAVVCSSILCAYVVSNNSHSTPVCACGRVV